MAFSLYDATVANYLQSKYNIPPHKFYLVGIGKDQQVASDSTAAGRAKNRRVDIKLLSNMSDQKSTTASTTGPKGQQSPCAPHRPQVFTPQGRCDQCCRTN